MAKNLHTLGTGSDANTYLRGCGVGYKVPFFYEPPRELPTIGPAEDFFIVRTERFFT